MSSRPCTHHKLRLSYSKANMLCIMTKLVTVIWLQSANVSICSVLLILSDSWQMHSTNEAKLLLLYTP